MPLKFSRILNLTKPPLKTASACAPWEPVIENDEAKVDRSREKELFPVRRIEPHPHSKNGAEVGLLRTKVLKLASGKWRPLTGHRGRTRTVIGAA
jgi:hypothetical protein